MQSSSPAQPQKSNQSLPETSEVASGIWKITVPIPFPLRTVNMYVFTRNSEWAIFDTAIGVPEARKAFSKGIQQIGLELDQLRTIVLSHDHPDHIGLSGELHERSGAKVYMHPIDEKNMRYIWSGTLPESFQHTSMFFKQHGMPPADKAFSQTMAEQMHTIIRIPPHEAITFLEDGQYLDLLGERYRVIWTPGHSDGHICLFRERDGVFLAADHVLPRITPNIGLYSEYDRINPLGDYLHSLKKVSSLPATIILPGHGEPFTHLVERTQELAQHHKEREAQILALLDQHSQHAYSIAEQLFAHLWKNNDAHRMAVAEALSHLEHLRINGQVKQRHTSDGLILYAVA